MYIPDSYYYNDKREANQYTHKPQGILDVNRLVKNQAPWKKLNFVSELKPKALIFCDWTLRYYSKEKLSAVHKKLSDLMEHGFSVYLWQDGTVNLLNTSLLPTFTSKNIAEALTPEFPSAIFNAALNQHYLVQNKVHLIDDYEMNVLLGNEKDIIPRQLNVRELHDLPESQQDTIISALKIATPPLKELIHDTFPIQAKQLTSTLNRLFPQVSVKAVYRNLILDEEQVELLVTNAELQQDGFVFNLAKKEQIKKISILSTDTSPAQTMLLKSFPELEVLRLVSDNFVRKMKMIRLESLYLDSPEIRGKGLSYLLAEAPNLKSLEFFSCNNLEPGFAKNLKINTLKELTVSDSNMASSDLEELLNQNPQLQMLNLINCKQLSLSAIAERINLPKLESLQVNRVEFSIQTLEHLLKDNTSLQKLIIIDSRAFSSHSIENLHLPRLTELNLAGSNIIASQLQFLLKGSPHLEKLDVTECSNLLLPFTISTPLPSLTVCKLSKSSLTGENINHLLQGTRKLKQLDISNCKSLDNICGEKINLSSLEDFNASYSEISSDDLGEFFKTATKLKKLNLSRVALTKISTKTLNLTSLLELDLANFDISPEILVTLLSKATSLKRLNLRGYKFFSEEVIGKIQLPSLQILNLRESSLKTEDLENLLAKSRNLKELDLTYCVRIIAPFTKPIYLTKLEKLVLSRSIISANALGTMLSSAKSLKTLDLTGCQNLQDDCVGTLDLDSLQSLYLYLSNINPQLLKIILLAAPCLSYLTCNDSLTLDEEMEELLIKVEKKIYTTLTPSTTAPTPASIIEEKKQIFLDADTTYDAEKKFKITRYFFSLDSQTETPDATKYRLDPYNTGYINPHPCKQSEAFCIRQEGSPHFISAKIAWADSEKELLDLGKNLAQKSATGSWFFGKKVLTLTDKWQAIPSLSFDEVLNYASIYPRDTSVSVQYSKRDNQYYIRGLKQQEITFCFLLNITPTESIALPEEISKLVSYFSNFKMDSLDLSAIENPTGVDYLNGIIQQRTGACRHRALAFKMLMYRYYPNIPVRIICNDCHAFPEIKINEQWVDCNLEGYPSELSIDESLMPADYNLESSSTPTMQLAIFDPTTYEIQLETWQKHRPQLSSVLTYCQQTLQLNEDRKRLIELTRTQDVHALCLSLQHYCQHISRPFFYINSPDDLICSASFVAREKEGNKGVLTKGPGGSLYNFLQKEQDPKNPPVLIVNYDNFDADDIIRFNGLLDKTRHADGTLLGDAAQVVGLLNINKPNCYQGSDFYSRFNTIETPEFTTNLVIEHVQQIAHLSLREKSEHDLEYSSIPINLFHASDWQERLLGRWEINGDTLYFIEGELQAALDKGLPIEIQNGPWDNESFRIFWQQASILGYVNYADRKTIIPPTLQLITSEGYEWNELKQYVQFDTVFSVAGKTLNPELLSEFFNHHQSIDEKLYPTPGYLQNYAKQELHVNLTRTLSKAEWALLLTECQKNQTQLKIHCAYGVELPDNLSKKEPLEERKLPVWDGLDNTSTTVIVSTDSTYTLSQLSVPNSKNYQIIEVSECESDDLLIATRYGFDEANGAMLFKKTKQALLNGLEENKTVILKGNFTPALIDHLAPELLARQNNPLAPGKLIILTPKDDFNYFPAQQHQVSEQEKLQYLQENFSYAQLSQLEVDSIATKSLSQLQTQLNYIASPISDKNAWQGMQGISEGIKLDEFDEIHSAEIAEKFNKNRVQAVQEILMHSPYVFLSGLTGVGKSTFVEKNLKTAAISLHLGESQLTAWAEDDSNKQKILFIDEANLSPRQWSEFEGLFNNPPGILIKGKYFPLTNQHQVIFAGNPTNYGDERQLAPLFARHGNALIFTPLPQEFIYEHILKPVFANTLLENHEADICRPFLSIYRFLCECSQNTVLISPREVQMMALLTLSYTQRYSGSLEEAKHAAQHYAYQLAANLVPLELRPLLEERFKPAIPLPQNPASPNTAHDFLITPSRQSIYQKLDDLLALHELRQKNKDNEPLAYGGLGGIILEGAPGIGKSELVIHSLRLHGYEEVHDFNLPRARLPNKPFYRMPVSMQNDDKKNLLLKAFHEGAVVIIDEINSSPMMERLLNDLLMGKDPDKNRPDNPGFLVIGTQNPITMAGRRAPSNALARRLITDELPSYNTEEMIHILHSKGLALEKAQGLVMVYEKNVKKAQTEHLSPEPTFRDLLNLVEQIITADRKSQAELNKLLKDTIFNFNDCNTTNRVSLMQDLFLQMLQQIAPLAEINLLNSQINKIKVDALKRKWDLTLATLHFDDHLKQFELITAEMENMENSNSNTTPASVARVFCNALRSTKESFLNKENEDFETVKLDFVKNCLQHLDAAKPTLQKYDDWKKLLLKFITEFSPHLPLDYQNKPGLFARNDPEEFVDSVTEPLKSNSSP